MKESGFQAKIIKAVEANGGVVVNGIYSKAGIADLVAGMPCKVPSNKEIGTACCVAIPNITILRHIHIEVKTKDDYAKLFRLHKGGRWAVCS